MEWSGDRKGESRQLSWSLIVGGGDGRLPLILSCIHNRRPKQVRELRVGIVAGVGLCRLIRVGIRGPYSGLRAFGPYKYFLKASKGGMDREWDAFHLVRMSACVCVYSTLSLGTIEEERTAERKGSMWEYLIV